MAHPEKEIGLVPIWGRLISRKLPHIWLSNSPDLTPPDFYYFWSGTMTEIRQSKPNSWKVLTKVLEDFIGSLEDEALKKVARCIKERAKVCFLHGGRLFKYKYKEAQKKMKY